MTLMTDVVDPVVPAARTHQQRSDWWLIFVITVSLCIAFGLIIAIVVIFALDIHHVSDQIVNKNSQAEQVRQTLCALAKAAKLTSPKLRQLCAQ